MFSKCWLKLTVREPEANIGTSLLAEVQCSEVIVSMETYKTPLTPAGQKYET